MEAQEAVLGDGGLVSLILSGFPSGKDARDRSSAALVCTLWNEAVRWTTSELSLRSSSCLGQLAPRFPNVSLLDLIWCCESLTDSDLELVAKSFRCLKSLWLGNELRPQEKVTSLGLTNVARSCGDLEDLRLASLPNISDQGIEAVCTSCKSLKSLSLENCVSLTDKALRSLSACSGLSSLTLTGGCEFTASGLASGVGSCRELVKVALDFRRLDIDPALRAVASECGKVQEVDVKFRHATLTGLVGCSSLRSLSVCSDELTAQDSVILDIVEANKELAELTYTNSFYPLRESTVIHIAIKCRRLRKLRLDVLSLCEVTLTSIAHCKELEHLALESSLEGQVRMELHGLQRLRGFSAHRIRDVDMYSLVDAKTLEHLDLRGCTGLNPTSFAAIALCTGLKCLDLSFTKVDDIGLSQIAAGVRDLKSLRLVKCEEVSSSLSLGLFSKLEHLQVDQSPFVTDVGMETIGDRCRSLKVISLSFTHVTDAGLLWLLSCSGLRVLGVPYCKGVRGEGIAGLGRGIKLRLVVLSHRFRNSEVVKTLEENHTLVRFEEDDMALVPFGL